MVGGKVGAIATGPGIEKIKRDMAQLMKMDVLVGIPEEKASRRGRDRVNNAELMYIHTHGSPLRGIPARPVIEAAIEAPDNKEKIGEGLGTAAKMALSGRPDQAKQQLRKVGMLGRNIARAWFRDPRNNWPPNSPTTILHKINKMSGKKRRDALAEFAATGESSQVQTLVDTAQMQNAITFVVREGK